ncbi:MAG: MaoC family dehydratase N-terminal domain-containing protein [Alphaproteobacteria bacterium]|nr:MaoC family dehydratase N-terminal domain-containing protein [Alphaproteobacteria bacterium]
MALDYDRLRNWEFADVEHAYGTTDTILYALGVGLGADPLDARQLRFVYEEDLLALPTMAVVLGAPGFWLKEQDTGVDWVRVLHGEQGLVLHRPLPPEGTAIGSTRVTGILDKGADKGALIYTEKVLIDKASGETVATTTSTTFARGDGGFGGPTGPSPRPHPIPERAPDLACDLPTVPQAALIYRLSGDRNPLHADPEVARAAGFKAPILHGLCTLGAAGHALLKSCCDYDPARFRSLKLRFSAPVYPGETIRTEMWRDGAIVSFRSRALERDAVVLDNGRAEVG